VKPDATVWLYARLLRLYPAAYRARWAEEQARVYRSERRALSAATGGERLRHAAAAFGDVVRSAAAERVGVVVSRWHARGTPSRHAARSAKRRRNPMDELRRDVRQGLRTLSRNPVFAAVAVLTIALGIGANTAIFSVVRAVLLRPLPYTDAERLVVVQGEMVNRNVTNWPTSPPDFVDYREQVTLLESLEAVWTFSQPLTGADAEPEQVEVAAVTPGFLPMLGARAVAGRLFEASDAAPPPPDTPPAEGPPAMIVLSHELWQRRFGGDREMIGRTIDMFGNNATVVGVVQPGLELYMPPGAGLSQRIDVWFAPRIDAATAPRNNVFLRMAGKLRAGVSVAQAQGQLDAAVGRIRAINERAESAGLTQTLVPMQEELTRQVRPLVLALLGAVGFVLLIACANVSNLLLVRAAAREREMAVRSALGGSRTSIIRQVLTESLVLAIPGGLLGLLIAAGGIRLLLALQPPDVPRLETVGIDGIVLGYTALATVAAAILFGLLPAARASRTNLASVLKDRGVSAGGRRQARVHDAVVVLEVALSLVLLIGAGLMVRSFMALRDVDPGFDAPRILTFNVQVPGQRYPEAEQRYQFITGFRERLAALPGVTAVGAATPLPLSGVTSNGPYGTEDVLSDPERMRQAEVRIITEDYFAAMGTRVLDGRAFTDADRSDSVRYVVVDEVLARTTWPGERAVGKRMMIRFGTLDYRPAEVLGVVEHQRSASLAAEGRETLYYHDAAAGGPGGLSWLIHTDGDPVALAAGVRRVLAEIDPTIPITDVRPLQADVNAAMGPTRFALALIGVFGITALLLAAVGLYGVLAYTVRQRTPEIGIRMTFGAGGGSILRMVVRQGLALAAAGVGIGVVAALGLTRVIESRLVGVEATDPLTFIAVAVTFLAIAAVACAVPALRATRVDPLSSLRLE
jgi:putative ABC transport system permease protein